MRSVFLKTWNNIIFIRNEMISITKTANMYNSMIALWISDCWWGFSISPLPPEYAGWALGLENWQKVQNLEVIERFYWSSIIFLALMDALSDLGWRKTAELKLRTNKLTKFYHDIFQKRKIYLRSSNTESFGRS